MEIDILSIIGLDSGYTVKYAHLHLGKGVYLTVYTESSPNTVTISRLETFLSAVGICTSMWCFNGVTLFSYLI